MTGPCAPPDQRLAAGRRRRRLRRASVGASPTASRRRSTRVRSSPSPTGSSPTSASTSTTAPSRLPQLKPIAGRGRAVEEPDRASGDEWLDRIGRELDSCNVLLVVIGRHWLDCVEEGDGSTIGTTWRLGICSALDRGRAMRVIPALVDGVTMPLKDGLPKYLRPSLPSRCPAMHGANLARAMPRSLPDPTEPTDLLGVWAVAVAAFFPPRAQPPGVLPRRAAARPRDRLRGDRAPTPRPEAPEMPAYPLGQLGQHVVAGDL